MREREIAESTKKSCKNNDIFCYLEHASVFGTRVLRQLGECLWANTRARGLGKQNLSRIVGII
jgi:hypothetical protein